MKSNVLLTVLFLVGLISVSASAAITVSGKRLYDSSRSRYVPGRGVIYMQPNAMHHHFWDNFEQRRLEADLDLYKERGFDTIVLKPCWGDFVPEIWYFDTANVTPVYDQDVFDLLELIVDKAAERDMYVLIMTGVMTSPKLYTDAGTTLSTRIGTANYSVYYIAGGTWALYADTNTNTLWNDFQGDIADALKYKDNVIGHVIEPETTGYPFREMTTTEVAGWNNAIKNVDACALTGYTPLNKNSTTCNMANTDIIFQTSYPGSGQFSSASNLSNDISSIRAYNSTKPILIRETGVSTYDYSQTQQSAYLKAARNACEEGSERIAGYCFWMSQDFDPDVFADPGTTDPWEYSQSAFGLWDIDCQAKAGINWWIKMPVVNPSFESIGSGGAPDGWDTVWAYNGSPSGWSAQRYVGSPYSGSYCLRMYTGTGAPEAIIFSQSDKTQCTPNTPLTVRAQMRYALASGTAYLAVAEYDENDNLTQWQEETFTGGSWTWKQNEINFITHPDTTYCRIRFGVGGESEQYLDVDLQEDLLSHRVPNPSFELDNNSNDKPDGWEMAYLWNGSRTGWYASRASFPTSVVNGTHCMRVYTGASGDSGARVMVDSNFFMAQPSTQYDIPAYIRFSSGSGYVGYSVFEYDSGQNYLGGHSEVIYGSGWEFYERTVSFTSGSTTKYLKIRFSVGGASAGMYCDVDWVRDYK